MLFFCFKTNSIFNQELESPLMSVLHTEGIDWFSEKLYETIIFSNEYGDAQFRTYPLNLIARSGFYRLANQITSQLTINASNVTLDMNGFSITGASNGIVVNGNLSNITIYNGVIESVTSDGLVVNPGCKNIYLKDITIKNAIRGIYLNQTIDGCVENCDLYLNTTGLELNSCHNIVVKNCFASQNKSVGYGLLSSTTCVFEGCEALSTGFGNTSIATTDISGFASRNGVGNIFERCIANATQGITLTGFNAAVAGFSLTGSETCSQIIDSQAGNSLTNSSGVTSSYGVLIKPTVPLLTLVNSTGTTRMDRCAWSPDGKYLAAVQSGGAGNQFFIYQVDYIQETMSLVASTLSAITSLFDVAWSPCGQFLTVGLSTTSTQLFRIYSFDRHNNKLIALNGDVSGTGSVYRAQWHPSGRYILICASAVAGNKLRLYRFDPVTYVLTLIAGDLSTGNIYGGAWSPDGKYFAIGGDTLTAGAGNLFRIYRFNQQSETITEIGGALSTVSYVEPIAWSPSGRYIGVGGDGFPTNDFIIYRFNATTETFSQIAGAGGTTGSTNALSWSPDEGYLAISYNGQAQELKLYAFDPGIPSLSLLQQTEGTGSNFRGSAFSPTGEYFAAARINGTFKLLLYRAFIFPSGNVLNNVQVNGNGESLGIYSFGISGSSMSNLITQNTAYDSNFNYRFAANVFNPLFGLEPTLLQNVSLQTNIPIPQELNITLRLQRIETLAQSLADNLL